MGARLREPVCVPLRKLWLSLLQPRSSLFVVPLCVFEGQGVVLLACCWRVLGLVWACSLVWAWSVVGVDWSLVVEQSLVLSLPQCPPPVAVLNPSYSGVCC